MSSTIWEKEDKKAFFALSLLSPFSFIVMLIALLAGGLMALFEPYLIAGALALVVVLFLKQFELAAGFVLLISLYIDWYLDYRVVALILAPLLLLLFFLNRSPQRPWTEPEAWWLWALFLGLSIFPAIHGALTVHDLVLYYPSIIFGALIMFWLGLLIGRDIASVRRFFIVLAGLATLIAIHTIIQATTGITLFQSQAALAYLQSVSNYALTIGTQVYRVGSFFIDPNWNSVFLALMFFIPLGLFFESTSLLHRILYCIEAFIILLALLFTYSTGSWLAAAVGLFFFVILVGRTRHRIQIILFVSVVAAVLLFGFSSQTNLLLQHSSDPAELQLRNAVWQTALHVIAAYPLTGVGLGHEAYLERAEPFRVIGQILPYDHPHNSYLEWGAMAGLPVLAVFLALLLFFTWQALANWLRASVSARPLLAAGIAAIITISVNSWSINGWTLPTLAAAGWIILGTIASPLLKKSLSREEAQELPSFTENHLVSER